MASNLLLTPELREKVRQVVEACYEKAERHYKKKFKRPTIHFDLHNTNGGEAWPNKNLLRYNLTFLVENEELFLNTTVKHEPAHLIARALHPDRKIRSHGKEWAEVMELFDLAPAKEYVKHSYDITSLDRRPKQRANLSKKLRLRLKLERMVREVEKLKPEDRDVYQAMLLAHGLL